jgi:hypothetical protein
MSEQVEPVFAPCRRRARRHVAHVAMALAVTAPTALGGCAAPAPEGLAARAPAAIEDARSRPADGMVALNEAARAAYRDARAELLARVDPILVAGPESLVLIHGGKRTAVEAMPPDYTGLKMLSHVTLGLHALLLGQEGPLAPARLPRLAAFRALMVELSTSLGQRVLAPALLEPQRRLLASSFAFVDGILARRVLAEGELVAFERRVAPSLQALLEDAVQRQLDWTHAEVSAFRRTLSPSDWRSLRVVVIGGHQPRQGYVMMQYFQRLLGEPLEGRRIVYAEGLWDVDRALELLGTHLLDATLGEGFFGDPLRFHRDLLGDAAAAYLPKILPDAAP